MITHGSVTSDLIEDYLAEKRERLGPRTRVEEFESAWAIAGRNHAPAMLFDWFYGGRLLREDMCAVVIAVWTSAEFPQDVLTVDQWCRFFAMADYPKPSGPLTLYRGATKGRARGMAWTSDRNKAQWFADRFARFATGKQDDRFGPAYVYTVATPPGAVLAVADKILAEGGRGEREVIVDPRLLPKVRRVADKVMEGRS